MWRPKLEENVYSEDIYSQIIDWSAYDDYDDSESDSDIETESDDENNNFKKKYKIKKYKIRAFGVTDNGNSICININDFTPYFFFKIPQNWGNKELRLYIQRLKTGLNNYCKDSLIEFRIVYKKDFYGFTNNTEYKYAQLVFKNINGFYAYKKELSKNIKIPKLRGQTFNFEKSLYETGITPFLRFFHIKDIFPSGWVKLPHGKYIQCRPKISRCQIDININWKDIISIDKNKITPMLIASFDIECTSKDGSFPTAKRESDKIIQIGTTVHRYGEKECFLKHIVTLKECGNIDDKDTIVESYNTEKEVLLAWAKFINDLDPDIITGYNIWGFDMSYIYDRITCIFNNGNGNYSEIFLNKISRLNDKTAKIKEKELSSSALGNNFLKWIDIEGVVQIDLLKLIQKDHNLDSYKLNNVSKVFMGMQKVDLSPKQLFSNYKSGTKEEIKEIAVYCIMDCELCNQLIMKLEVITNNIGMANVCIVPLSYLFLRGQGIKIYSLVSKQCRKENFLIKNLNIEDIDKSSYEGAIVFDPKPGVYFKPIAVMDYASLYPSSMIAENISHDSIVKIEEYDNNDKLISKKGLNKYDNLEEYNYNNIKYDVYKIEKFKVKDKIKEESRKVGYKICRYAEKKNGEKSLLPRVLIHLLNARKETKKKMKYKTLKDKNNNIYIGLLKEDENKYIVNNIENKKKYEINKDDILDINDTYNEFEVKVLDGLQLAYKVTCNSLYGQVGASTSPICLKELAASTTATGRNMVIIARDLTLEHFKGSELVYGDTDSVFIDFTGYINKDREIKLKDKDLLKETIKVGEEAGEFITSKLKKPQVLEYEKVFYPFCIFSKKRYVGNKYEFDCNNFKQTSMGIVLKRRDNAQIVKRIYGKIIDILLNEKNIDKTKKYYKDEICNLLKGNVDINELIISKSLRSDYSNPTQIAHKVLADRMGERDPGNKPIANDRIPYCYIDVNNIKCELCDELISEKSCKCIICMKLYCKNHLHNHKSKCKKLCRFCKEPNNLKQCHTCNAWYCDHKDKSCYKKHNIRNDKFKREFNDKCKKPLTNKLLQGDIIEEPEYIKSKKLKIDYRYYFDHQLVTPIMQIFELIMDNPKSLTDSIIRKDNNRLVGSQEITKWFKKI